MKTKIFIYVAIVIILYYFLHKYLVRKKYLDFFKEMGFGNLLLSKFTTRELMLSKDYITNYSRKGIELNNNNNPELYKEIKEINNRYHIFSSIK